MSNRKELCNLENCLGCMACYNACPQQAIEVYSDDLCALKTSIIDSKCISCNICTQVCPIINKYSGNKSKEGYAAYTKDLSVKEHCSSGGIASTFYSYYIENKGMVVGAKENGISELSLASSDNSESIQDFTGSKYVYANPGKIYKDVEKGLKAGKKCLFIGTPCQVDALNHYLRKEYENLLTVDIICHGTPPYNYFVQHINHINRKRKEIKSYAFRGECDWNLVVTAIDNTTIYQRLQVEDVYYYSFLCGLIHRSICYSCPYANEYRVSDITIGDFWGAPKGILDGYRGKVSAVLVNTTKGSKSWNVLSRYFVSERASIEMIVQGNGQLSSPSVMHPDRKAFEISFKETKDFYKSLKVTSIPRKVRGFRIKNFCFCIPRKIKQMITSIIR